MIKKFKRWYRQKFCKHNFVEIRDPRLTEFLNQQAEKGKYYSYSYKTEYQCVNCGKTKDFWFNTMVV